MEPNEKGIARVKRRPRKPAKDKKNGNGVDSLIKAAADFVSAGLKILEYVSKNYITKKKGKK